MDVFLYAEFSENGGFLGQVADSVLGPFEHGPAANFCIFEEDLTFIGSNETYKHVEGGCFSCAVWAKESNDFALVYFYAHVVHDAFSAILFDQILGA